MKLIELQRRLVYLLPREHTKQAYEKLREQAIEEFGYPIFRMVQTNAFEIIATEKVYR